MLKKAGFFFKTIGRNWFTFLIVIIILLFFYNQTIAIWLTIFSIFLFTVSYIPSLFFKRKLLKFMKGYDKITDMIIAKKLKKSVKKVRKKLFLLSKNQKRKYWLIVFLDKVYIFYNEKIIQNFKDFYNKGLGEKEILEELKTHFDINTRAEIKMIEKTLFEHKRLDKRDEDVKSYREIHKFMPS